MTLAEEEGETEGGTEIPVIVETYDVDEDYEPTSEKPESELMPVETQTKTQDESKVPPASTSEDSITIDIAEKGEPEGDAETVVESSEPEVKVVVAAPGIEEPAAKQEPEVNEEIPAEKAAEDEKVAEA
jgi:hypothetical protein